MDCFVCPICRFLIPQLLLFVPIQLSPCINASKIFLTNIILVVFHPKTRQSHLKVGQVRGSMPRSDPRLLLPSGKKSCKSVRVGWAGDTGSWKEPEKRKWDRQKKKHSLAGKSLGRQGGRSTQVPKYAVVTPCMKIYFFRKNTVRIYGCLHACKYTELQINYIQVRFFLTSNFSK